MQVSSEGGMRGVGRTRLAEKAREKVTEERENMEAKEELEAKEQKEHSRTRGR